VAGTGDLKHYHAGTNVKVLTSKREVFFYVSKYMGKAEDEPGCQCPGRFWGVVNPKNIPMGERKVIPCTGKQAAQLMRFMRRYVHAVTQRKYRFNNWSMSCMCDADFWLERFPALLDLSVMAAGPEIMESWAGARHSSCPVTSMRSTEMAAPPTPRKHAVRAWRILRSDDVREWSPRRAAERRVAER